jgi:HD-like signal output (HDOD) protein
MLAILEEILREIERLEPFPRTAARVLEVLAQTDLDPYEELNAVMPLVVADAALTTKVLRAANSSMRGAKAPIDSIQRACIELGSERTASLALASLVACRFMGLGGSTLRSQHSLWTESLATATACRLVAERCDYRDVELAFTAGLLQNLAFLVMDRFLRREHERIRARLDLGRSWLAAEREVLGTTHPFLGARIARKWRLPDVLVDVIRNHHSPTPSTADLDLCRIASVGEALAWAVLGEPQRAGPHLGTSVATAEALGLHIAVLEDLLVCLPAELATSRALLGEPEPHASS